MKTETKIILSGVVVAILFGIIGYSVKAWLNPDKSKYGTIEEMVKKVEKDSIDTVNFKDSILSLNQDLKNRSDYRKYQKQIQDEKRKKLNPANLSNFQRDSLERAIYEN